MSTRIHLTSCLTIALSDIASTSPPNSRGFFPSSVSSNSPSKEYEVEVVEIRVREGEIYDIIP